MRKSPVPAKRPLHPVFDRLQPFNRRLEKGKAENLYFYMRQVDSPATAHTIIRGQPMLMFSSNNYLGMANHPRVKNAAKRAVRDYGTGACSRWVKGKAVRPQEELEKRLAAWEGREAAMIYSSGYVSNVATLSTLLSRNDVAFIDEYVHASLIDGLRFGQIPFRTFFHNDMTDLAEKMAVSRPAGHAVIIVDGVYSMEGDIARLPDIYKLAKKHKALLVLDEAHGTGVLGRTGRGTAEHFGLHGKIDVVVGTLSKALGGVGGFVAGPKVMIDSLKHRAGAFQYSATLPSAVCAGILAAMDVIESEPEWLARLDQNARQLREGLQAQGWNTGHSESPIIPVMIGDDRKAYMLTRALYQAGIYASPITYPGVKMGTARVRLSVMATHSSEDIQRTLDIFARLRKAHLPKPMMQNNPNV